ncbi:5-methylcytosine-specific restriction endonuclease McrA [Weissella uvarum]|uniref:HNH endonuclease n=1 Tax=Weissella uvarum TaxID=1479233 RepID=UPI00195FFE29|nr:HNH endonuclease [Weissella uvarum]MBM7617262.1 5-methylcytosine-specific restriction endonuclease McrA [Weissella uvarum]MCM0595149.1 HNH endonuclease [Weissella uvarum]
MVRAHRCNVMGCHQLVKSGKKFCPIHEAEQAQRYADYKAKKPATRREQAMTKRYDETKRGELHDGFYYSKQWQQVSQYVKQRDGYTGAVDGKLYDAGELIVDHIVPRRLLENRVAMLDASNLWLLNRRQHNKKTGIEKKIPDEKLKNLDQKFWKKVLKEN